MKSNESAPKGIRLKGNIFNALTVLAELDNRTFNGTLVHILERKVLEDLLSHNKIRQVFANYNKLVDRFNALAKEVSKNFETFKTFENYYRSITVEEYIEAFCPFYERFGILDFAPDLNIILQWYVENVNPTDREIKAYFNEIGKRTEENNLLIMRDEDGLYDQSDFIHSPSASFFDFIDNYQSRKRN